MSIRLYPTYILNESFFFTFMIERGAVFHFCTSIPLMQSMEPIKLRLPSKLRLKRQSGPGLRAGGPRPNLSWAKHIVRGEARAGAAACQITPWPSLHWRPSPRLLEPSDPIPPGGPGPPRPGVSWRVRRPRPTSW